MVYQAGTILQLEKGEEWIKNVDTIGALETFEQYVAKKAGGGWEYFKGPPARQIDYDTPDGKTVEVLIEVLPGDPKRGTEGIYRRKQETSK